MPNPQPVISVGQRWEFKISSNVHVVTEVDEDKIFYRREGNDTQEPKWLSATVFLSKFRGPLDDAGRTAAPRLPEIPEGEIAPDRDEPKLGSIATPDERHEFENMILFPETEQEIIIGLNSINNRPRLEAVWNISKILPLAGRQILNFYGPPGTGKTMAAMCLAAKLRQPLYQVNYAEVVSKYHNATGEKIKMMFDECKRLKAVLFLDEADTLVTQRAGIGDGTNHPLRASHNNALNILMQELDKFNGIMIMATNFFENYDEALLRRISRNVEFQLPNAEMREQLIRMHFPKQDRVQAELHVVAADDVTKGFSGGDILNLCVNSMERASLDDDEVKWIVTTPLMRQEAKAIRDAKENHANKRNQAVG